MAMTAVSEKDSDSIQKFIRDTVSESGKKGVVLGISGGLDSAVAAKLACDAIGPENVVCVFMPLKKSSEEDFRISSSFSKKLGCRYEVVEIQNAVDNLISENASPLELGNLSARVRMAVLYGFALRENSLVMGTSNRSEIEIGYFTKYGDGGCDFLPLANLYKTQIYQLAEILGIPEEIVSKQPSAGFWDGQTDESELKMPYSVLDSVLFSLSQNKSAKQISCELNVPLAEVENVVLRMKNTEHKRKLPPRPRRPATCNLY